MLFFTRLHTFSDDSCRSTFMWFIVKVKNKERNIHSFVFNKNIIKKRDVSHSASTGRRFVLTQERRREENTSFLKEKYVNTFVYTSHEEGLLHNSPSMMSYRFTSPTQLNMSQIHRIKSIGVGIGPETKTSKTR